MSVLLSAGLAQGRESTNATGANATVSGCTGAGSNRQVVYTINTINRSSTVIVSQGVQHDYKIIPAGISADETKISNSIFPDTTADNLILQTRNIQISIFNLQSSTDRHTR